MATKEIHEGSNGQEIKEPAKTCGIIMPIDSHLDYTADHWNDVLQIIKEAIHETEFTPKLVSEDEAVGLIHERIITNLYTNEIVVCDVSGKNPNVMFELGIRLAFDKPTIIIKDDLTGFSFDTGVIEHLHYPASLKFQQVIKFKTELSNRIKATYEKSKESSFSPFLKSFGKHLVPTSIKETPVSEGKFILEKLEAIQKELFSLKKDRISDPYIQNLLKERELYLSNHHRVSMLMEDLTKKETIIEALQSRLKNTLES